MIYLESIISCLVNPMLSCLRSKQEISTRIRAFRTQKGKINKFFVLSTLCKGISFMNVIFNPYDKS